MFRGGAARERTDSGSSRATFLVQTFSLIAWRHCSSLRGSVVRCKNLRSRATRKSHVQMLESHSYAIPYITALLITTNRLCFNWLVMAVTAFSASRDWVARLVPSGAAFLTVS